MEREYKGWKSCKLSTVCLSSRVVYGLSIIAERLNQDIARIEVSPEDIGIITTPDVAKHIE